MNLSSESQERLYGPFYGLWLRLQNFHNIPNVMTIPECVFGGIGGGENPITIYSVNDGVLIAAYDIGNGAAAGQAYRLDGFVFRHVYHAPI